MRLQFIVGTMTLLTGIVLILVGTDYGRIINVTVGVIAGAVFVLLGISRLKQAWLNRDKEE
ncbi:MAG TPA: hypothetical protein DCP36_20365 [Sporomusaceae bacterium]|jgi:hypothetical protein|uniref:hypothetical protein n=1 Tax=Anaerospora sp. TaxID=1960278 RepID=UPI000EC74D96|nr:hypothetical protein [Anaerospora sp.]MDF2928476.1 hypothetical protein [Anaerospora sp.]HAK75311.1 hypothetical protein [Sporomusaceae bacterium]